MVVKHNLLTNMSVEDEKVLGATNPNEEENFEEEIDNDTDDVEVLKSQVEKERIAKQQILARAKKAEDEVRKLKSSEKPSQFNNVLSSEDIDTKILKSHGVPDDEINYLKKLAKVNETSIIEAQSDEIYKSYKANKEATEKAEKAKLGASRGGGQARKEKTLNSVGLSEADHKELWRQSQGQ